MGVLNIRMFRERLPIFERHTRVRNVFFCGFTTESIEEMHHPLCVCSFLSHAVTPIVGRATLFQAVLSFKSEVSIFFQGVRVVCNTYKKTPQKGISNGEGLGSKAGGVSNFWPPDRKRSKVWPCQAPPRLDFDQNVCEPPN